MNIIVNTSQMKVNGQVLKDYAAGKAERLTRFFDGITRIEVFVSPDGNKFRAEMVVAARRNHVFAGHATAPQAVAAVDASADKVERQLTRHKEKLKTRKFKETLKR